jgi:hypothetical protein
LNVIVLSSGIWPNEFSFRNELSNLVRYLGDLYGKSPTTPSRLADLPDLSEQLGNGSLTTPSRLADLPDLFKQHSDGSPTTPSRLADLLRYKTHAN